MAQRPYRPVWRAMVNPLDTHTLATAAADQTAAATEHSDDRTEAACMAEAAAPPVTAQPRRDRSHWSALELANEPSAEVRAAQGRAAGPVSRLLPRVWSLDRGCHGSRAARPLSTLWRNHTR